MFELLWGRAVIKPFSFIQLPVGKDRAPTLYAADDRIKAPDRIAPVTGK
ncbi:MAG TPA: hypothetical protein VH186_09205 [Chloroflexia bacterium]|nr:hypothetical protein [Chloroflexia bacterium]